MVSMGIAYLLTDISQKIVPPLSEPSFLLPQMYFRQMYFTKRAPKDIVC